MGSVGYNVKSIHTESMEASADLTEYQWHGMKMNADGEVTVCAADTDIPIGILTNIAKADGREAQVLVQGRCPIMAGETITYASLIRIDGSGHAMIFVRGTDTTAYSVGRCIKGGGNDEKIVAVVDFANPTLGNAD